MLYPSIPPNSVSFNFPPLVSQKEEFLNLDFIYSATKQGVQFDINLKYKFLSTEEIKKFLSFFDKVKGSWRTFGLPITIWQHPLPIRVALDQYLRFCSFWFKEKPRVTPQGSGIFDLDVELSSDLNFDQEWLGIPPEEPKPKFVIFCQDNAPPNQFSYWESQYQFYRQLKTDLEAISTDYEIITVFLNERDATLESVLSFPCNNSKQYSILVSGGSDAYLKANLSASLQFERDESTLASTREYFDRHPEFTYQIESFLLEYPNSFQEASWSKTKEISDNSLGLLESALTVNNFGSTQRIQILSNSSTWGGNRPTLKTAIENFFSSL